jgi:hypothetical protein
MELFIINDKIIRMMVAAKGEGFRIAREGGCEKIATSS